MKKLFLVVITLILLTTSATQAVDSELTIEDFLQSDFWGLEWGMSPFEVVNSKGKPADQAIDDGGMVVVSYNVTLSEYGDAKVVFVFVNGLTMGSVYFSDKSIAIKQLSDRVTAVLGDFATSDETSVMWNERWDAPLTTLSLDTDGSIRLLFGAPISSKDSEEKNIEQSMNVDSLSYNELADLKDQINLAMWNSDEWQEVKVPQGIWEVGVDIPTGHWTISPVEGGWGVFTI